MNRVCLAAILKDEERFIDEWIVYHRMLGIDHFFLYDDNPAFPLREFLKPYREYVTIVDWCGMDKKFPGRCNQTKAYTHALENYACNYDWVLYLDGDEFVVLYKHENIQDFLAEFDKYAAVALNWHVFGHNGHYNNPKGLITSSLTRRMLYPGKSVKSFTRPQYVQEIWSPHFCNLKHGKKFYTNSYDSGNAGYHKRKIIACINHYQCRSFKNWMDMPKRGNAMSDADDLSPEKNKWRYEEEACLRQFVETVAKDKNEYVDEYMLKYREFLENHRLKARIRN